jgi:2-polyprenyl-3-methyl-5-hydroxy-6-metoxy-1,4-benzoquinol methylase
MSKDNGSALSIDEIMHNVAKEVAYRATYQLDQTPVSLRPQPVPKITLEPVISFTQKKSYHRDEFMAYDDLQFVENAFLGVLQRPADETGLSGYVNFLRNGGDKEFVLIDLQSSGEAKNSSVVIAGLRWHRMRNRVRKLFPHSQFITRIIHKLDRFLAPWFRSSSALRHQLSVQTAVNQHADTTGHYLHNQLQTYAQQVELQAQQIKQLSIQAQANQSELAISRSHTHSLLSRLEAAPSHNNAQQKNSSQFTSQHKLDAFYLAFEDACRGTDEETSAKLQSYMPYVQKVVDEFGSKASAVDLGCGRGEWLQVLHQFSMAAQGIDLNQVMVDHCLANDHQVEQGDALTWMQRQTSQSQHLVSSFHVLEHIPFKEYYLWFEQFSRILAPGGILILETPNPENLLVASHTFYHDPTHLNPITPDLLEFTSKFFGLQVLAIERLNPYPESAKVKGHDELTERVNGHLCGPQDFALIAIKPVVVGTP